MKKFLRKLWKQDVYNSIPNDDLISKQRYSLFRIYSLTAFLVAAIVAVQMLTAFAGNDLVSILLGMVSIILVTNFYMANDYRKLAVPYIIACLATFLIVHIQSYSAGGIVNSGTMYLAVVIVCAYMMLGSKAGKWFTALTLVHFIYLYIISEETNWTSNALFQNDPNLINQDFLTTGILAFILISAQSNYLHSGKNVIIERITEQRDQLEKANVKLKDYTTDLEKTNKELDKFASIVSHDLKAPLRAIGNLTDWIEEDAGPSFNEETRKNFDTIKQRVKRMEDLIQAILDYSKADKRFGDEIKFDTSVMVNEIKDFIGIEDHIKVDVSDMPVLTTDKTRLQQVMANLIGNAVKYTDTPSPQIHISAKTEHNGWVFSVKDNGPGIDPMFHEKIFVIFQTLNRRDKVESTGVGLAIVKKIVEDHGGKIWVESELGKGADFKFFWPKEKKQKDSILIAATIIV